MCGHWIGPQPLEEFLDSHLPHAPNLIPHEGRLLTNTFSVFNETTIVRNLRLTRTALFLTHGIQIAAL